MRQIKRPGRYRQAFFPQHLGVLLGKSRRNLTSYFGISPQFQGFVLTAPASQIGTVRPDQVEPGFIEKLTQSRRARAFVLRVGIAVGFNTDDPLDHRVDGRSASKIIRLSREAKSDCRHTSLNRTLL